MTQTEYLRKKNALDTARATALEAVNIEYERQLALLRATRRANVMSVTVDARSFSQFQQQKP